MPDLPTVDLLGWTLLHFVWQGALLAALLAGVLHLLQNHTPRVRYAVSCVALLGLFALPVGTSVLLIEQEASVEQQAAATVAVAPAVSTLQPSPEAASVAKTDSSWRDQVIAGLQPVLPWVVLGWGIGVMIFALRLVGGAWRVRRLRRTSTPVSSAWQKRLQALSEQMGLRRSVGLRQSDCVEGPVVAGWWRPVILVPAGLLSGLPPEQVEALLLHELAHVRRHDVLVGRLQAVVETLLFFHPATWWISQQVRQSREACCDDRAVRAGTDRTVYARALTAVAERAVAGSTTAWAPAASDGSLLSRIRRLLSPEASPSKYAQGLSMAAAVLLLMGVPLGLAACASQQSTTEADSQTSAATTEVEAEEPVKTNSPSAPKAPSADAERQKIIVVQGDSTKHTVRVEADGPVEVDSLEKGVYVFRYNGRTDTLDVPHLDEVPHLDRLERGLEFRFDSDSLDRALRARINPDSLEREIRLRFDPDSLEQDVLQMRLRADSLLRWHGEHADSLRRHVEEMRERMEREMPDRLREQARHLREQAERMEERAEELEAPEPPEAPEAPTDTSGRSDASIQQLERTEEGTIRARVRVDDRDTILVAQVERHPIPAKDDLDVLLRTARRASHHQQRAEALEALAKGPYAERPTAQRLFRQRARDTSATDLERWRALSGLGQHGGARAVAALETVRETAQNAELRGLARHHLEQTRPPSEN